MTRAACCRAGCESPPEAGPRVVRFALVGQPNTGRTTLFNRLCGVRARTANYPGTTCQVRLGRCSAAGRHVLVADLPGTYGLDLDLPESRICRAYLENGMGGREAPGAVLVVIDASNLARSLAAAGDVLRFGLPVVVALNKIDLARRRGLPVDVGQMRRALGVPVVAVSARGGENLVELVEALAAPEVLRQVPPEAPPDPARWAHEVAAACLGPAPDTSMQDESLADRMDALFTHPLAGLLVFAGVMTALFMAIFSLAELPMNLIELLFGWLGSWLRAALPAGPVRSLAAEGIVAGLAGTIVFLPQIFLLFFLIGLLEDSGYLARAAFVAERILRRFGLPGHAFVPLLSAHACAIPAIMSARLVPDPRDRLATILVAPFMSCSARLPVYVLLIGLLFPGQPLAAGLAFSGCYALGACAAVLVAALLRRTVIGGRARPLVLELPDYQWPSLRSAALSAFDRALAFLRNAATVIMAICVVLWWLSAYPLPDPTPDAVEIRAPAASVAPGEARHALAQSYMGRLGRLVQPAFEPLGFDWQLSVGVLSSFAAREVFVSTMAVMCGAPGGAGDSGDPRLLDRIRSAARDDGTPVFSTSSAAALLVFYVLAMQCLPTLAVTRREAGGWRWAALQLGLMSGLAYGAAFALRRSLIFLGVP